MDKAALLQRAQKFGFEAVFGHDSYIG
jgi:hypothetical protein